MDKEIIATPPQKKKINPEKTPTKNKQTNKKSMGHIGNLSALPHRK